MKGSPESKNVTKDNCDNDSFDGNVKTEEDTLFNDKKLLYYTSTPMVG
jgi:hypothetical protein